MRRLQSVVKITLTVAYIALLSGYSCLRGLLLGLRPKHVLGVRYKDEIARLRADGCVILEGYYSDEEVDRVRRIADDHMCDEYGDYDNLNRRAYFRRPTVDQSADGGVFRLFGADSVDGGAAAFFEDEKIRGIIEAAFRTRVYRNAALLQKNQPFGSETRGYHVDMYAPKQFKAFLFLTDVEDQHYGPLTVIIGSHRWLWRRYKNYVVRGLSGQSDVSSFDNLGSEQLDAAQLFTVKKGTVVIATQQAVHRGWPLKIGPRYVLVSYYVEKLSRLTPGYHVDKRLGYRYTT